MSRSRIGMADEFDKLIENTLPAVDRLFGRSLFRRPAVEQGFEGNRFAGLIHCAQVSCARCEWDRENSG